MEDPLFIVKGRVRPGYFSDIVFCSFILISLFVSQHMVTAFYAWSIFYNKAFLSSSYKPLVSDIRHSREPDRTGLLILWKGGSIFSECITGQRCDPSSWQNCLC